MRGFAAPQDRRIGHGALARRIAIGYLAVAAAWIVGSDLLLALATGDERSLWPSLGKGLAFVVVTAALVYGLVVRALARSAGAETERAHAESERRLELALRATRTGVWEWNVRSDAVYWSAEAVAIVGAAPESPRLADFTGRVHPDDVAGVMAAARAALETRSEFTREFRIVRPDGALRWVRNLARGEYGDDGAPLRMVGTVRDVTDEKATELELRQSEARFRAMIEQSISGTCMIGADRRFVYANPRLAAILGYDSPEALVGRPVLEFVLARDHALVERNMRERLQGSPKAGRYHFRAVRRDGSGVTLGAHGTLGAFEGRPVLIVTVQDVTELRRAEEEVERTVARLQRAVQGTIQVVSAIGELRDPYTHGHERRVGEVATAIARELGLREEAVEGIRVAGYLHDVGKIGVPAEILAKPSRLTKAEFDLVKQHAQQSYDILRPMEFPWPVAEAAWAHHERLDGSGYPRGLKGDDIPLEARVLAVADTVEAMASHRPYRPGLGIERALAEVERGRGSIYDAAAVDACLALFRDKGYVLPG